MLDIKITEEELVIRGHAGYAPRGYDIVCAAATILSYISGVYVKYAAAPRMAQEKTIYKP